jgi:Vitamin K-dependent gamma-carboxylase
MDGSTQSLTQKTVTLWLHQIVNLWQQFWFVPSQPHTLALLRILGGSMIFYTHLVWSKNLIAFLGPNAWIDRDTAKLLNTLPSGANYTFSHLYYFDSPSLLWLLHAVAMLIFLAFTLGFYTRITSVLTWLLTVSYAHRLVGTQYGLDQVNSFLAMYLMLCRCGDVYSLDHWLATRSGRAATLPTSDVMNTIALRLIQLHLCAIYLFGGISKMRGDSWWDGSAIWFAIANYEYQSWNVAWLIHARWFIAGLALVTMFWETFYCVLVWPKWCRPIMLALAVGVHGFIALCLGMITFGTAMLIMNLAFVDPQTIQRFLAKWSNEPYELPKRI